MTLWRFEIKKMLQTHKGIWLLAICLLAKLMFLAAVPEQKDSRILLSQKQYDKYLAQLHGENTPEKAEWIRARHACCENIINRRGEMERAFQSGSVTEEAWLAYCDDYDRAYLHRNAAAIFAEKEQQFAAQPAGLPPAHYIYEYGWQTVFSLQRFPDVFLLFGLLFLTAQCYSAEAADGMLPVLLAARDGRGRLFRAKLLALLAVSLAAALTSAGLEAAVFLLRGWCADGGAPLYSITLFSEDCPLRLSLAQGYLLCLVVRTFAALLFAAAFYGLSVWLQSITNLLFSAVCVLAAPMLAGSAGMLFTHAGLLCGSRMLLLLGASGIPLLLPLAVVTAYSLGALFLAAQRYQKGL